MFNYIITKSIRKHLSGQWRDGDSRTLPLQNVAKVFEVRVAPSHGAMLELEGGDVGAADDLVVGVHAAGSAMSLWVLDL